VTVLLAVKPVSIGYYRVDRRANDPASAVAIEDGPRVSQLRLTPHFAEFLTPDLEIKVVNGG